MSDLKVLVDQVAAADGAEKSTIVMVNGLAALIESSKNDPAAISDLAGRMREIAPKLGAAVAGHDDEPPPEKIAKRASKPPSGPSSAGPA